MFGFFEDSKKDKYGSDNDFDLDKDIDLDELDLDAMMKKGDDRITVRGIAKATGDELLKSATDPHKLAGFASKFLPDETASDVDDTLEAFDTTLGVIDNAVEKSKPIVSEIATKTKKLIPENWTRVQEFLDNFIQEKYVGGRIDPRKAEEERITKTLNDIFAQQMAQQEATKQEERAENAVKEKIQEGRDKATYTALSNINLNIQRLTDYNSKVNAAYQRKSLEIQLRSFNIQANTYELLKQYTAKSTGLFDAIMHNTALPDFVKTTKSEIFKKAFADRLTSKAVDIVGKRGFGRYATMLAKNIKGQLMGGVSKLSDFGMLAGAADMLTDESFGTKEQTMMNLGASFLVSGLSKIAGGAFKKTETGREFQSKMKKVSNMASTMPSLFSEVQEWAKKSEAAERAKRGGDQVNLLDLSDLEEEIYKREGIKGLSKERQQELEEAKKKYEKLSWYEQALSQIKTFGYRSIGQLAKSTLSDIKGSGSVDMKRDDARSLRNPSVFTRGAEKSLTQIIPGYLARILQQATIIANGGKPADLLIYDHSTDKFITSTSLKDKVITELSKEGSRWKSRNSDIDEALTMLFGTKKVVAKEDPNDNDGITEFEYDKGSWEQAKFLNTDAKKAGIKRALNEFIISNNLYNLANPSSYKEKFRTYLRKMNTKYTEEEVSNLKTKDGRTLDKKNDIEPYRLFSDSEIDQIIGSMLKLQGKDKATMDALNEAVYKLDEIRNSTSINKNKFIEAQSMYGGDFEQFLQEEGIIDVDSSGSSSINKEAQYRLFTQGDYRGEYYNPDEKKKREEEALRKSFAEHVAGKKGARVKQGVARGMLANRGDRVTINNNLASIIDVPGLILTSKDEHGNTQSHINANIAKIGNRHAITVLDDLTTSLKSLSLNMSDDNGKIDAKQPIDKVRGLAKTNTILYNILSANTSMRMHLKDISERLASGITTNAITAKDLKEAFGSIFGDIRDKGTDALNSVKNTAFYQAMSSIGTEISDKITSTDLYQSAASSLNEFNEKAKQNGYLNTTAEALSGVYDQAKMKVTGQIDAVNKIIQDNKGKGYKAQFLAIMDYAYTNAKDFANIDPENKVLQQIAGKLGMKPEELLSLPKDKFEELKAKVNIPPSATNTVKLFTAKANAFKAKTEEALSKGGDKAIATLKALHVLPENFTIDNSKGVYDNVKNVAGTAYDNIKETISNYTLEDAKEQIKECKENIYQRYNDAKQSLKDLYETASEGLKTEQGRKDLRDKLDNWYKGQKETIETKYKGARAYLEAKANELKKKATEEDASWFYRTASQCYDVMSDFADTIFSWGGTASEWVHNLADKVKEKLKQGAAWVGRKITGEEVDENGNLTASGNLNVMLRELREKYGKEDKGVTDYARIGAGHGLNALRMLLNGGFSLTRMAAGAVPIALGLGKAFLTDKGGLGAGLEALAHSGNFAGRAIGKVLGGIYGKLGKIRRAFDETKILEESMDLYFPGSNTPVIRKTDIDSGHLFDVSTKRQIKMIGDIRGEVIYMDDPSNPDSSFHVVLTLDDIKKHGGLLNAKGEDLARFIINNMLEAADNPVNAIGSVLGEKGKGGKVNVKTYDPNNPSDVEEVQKAIPGVESFKGKTDQEKAENRRKAVVEITKTMQEGKLTANAMKDILYKYVMKLDETLLGTGRNALTDIAKAIGLNVDKDSFAGRTLNTVSGMLGIQGIDFGEDSGEEVLSPEQISAMWPPIARFKGKSDEERLDNARAAKAEIERLHRDGKATRSAVRNILNRYAKGFTATAFDNVQGNIDKALSFASKRLRWQSTKGIYGEDNSDQKLELNLGDVTPTTNNTPKITRPAITDNTPKATPTSITDNAVKAISTSTINRPTATENVIYVNSQGEASTSIKPSKRAPKQVPIGQPKEPSKRTLSNNDPLTTEEIKLALSFYNKRDFKNRRSFRAFRAECFRMGRQGKLTLTTLDNVLNKYSVADKKVVDIHRASNEPGAVGSAIAEGISSAQNNLDITMQNMKDMGKLSKDAAGKASELWGKRGELWNNTKNGIKNAGSNAKGVYNNVKGLFSKDTRKGAMANLRNTGSGLLKTGGGLLSGAAAGLSKLSDYFGGTNDDNTTTGSTIYEDEGHEVNASKNKIEKAKTTHEKEEARKEAREAEIVREREAAKKAAIANGQAGGKKSSLFSMLGKFAGALSGVVSTLFSFGKCLIGVGKWIGSVPGLIAKGFSKIKGLGGLFGKATSAASAAGKTGMLSKVKAIGSKVPGLAIAASAFQVFDTAVHAKNNYEKAEGYGGAVGSLAGATAGAALGSMIFPGVGTLIGGIAGGLLGDKVVGSLAKWFVSPDDYTQLRLIQYGFGDDDDNYWEDVLKFETYIRENATITSAGEKADIDPEKISSEAILDIFNLDRDDEEFGDQMKAISEWIAKRFKPVYCTHLNAYKKYTGSEKIENLISAKDEQKYQYLKAIKKVNGLDWNYKVNPFDIEEELEATEEEFMQLWTKLKDKLPEKMKSVIDKAETDLIAKGGKPGEAIKLDKNGKVIPNNSKGNINANSGKDKGPYVVPTALECIRFKLYGVTKIVRKEVDIMRSVEEAIEDKVKINGETASLDMDIEEILSKVGQLFGIGIDDLENEKGERFKKWFNERFLVVYLKYINEVYKVVKTQKREKIESLLTNIEAIYNLALFLSKIPDVWNKKTSPWGDDYELNTDPDTITKNIVFIENQIRKQAIQDQVAERMKEQNGVSATDGSAISREEYAKKVLDERKAKTKVDLSKMEATEANIGNIYDTLMRMDGNTYTKEGRAEFIKNWLDSSKSGAENKSRAQAEATMSQYAYNAAGGDNVDYSKMPGSTGTISASSANGKPLGFISAKYESGGKSLGYDVISSGKGDAGGKSYGSHQIASKSGTLQEFLRWSPYGKQFQGLALGSPQFDAKWKQLAKSDPGFGKSQDDFIAHTHMEPQLRKLKNKGIDLSTKGRAVQEALYSTAVQYRGLTSSRVFPNALKGQNVASLSDKDIVNLVQDEKKANNENYFKSSSPAVRKGVYNRIDRERKDLLALVGQGSAPMDNQSPIAATADQNANTSTPTAKVTTPTKSSAPTDSPPAMGGSNKGYASSTQMSQVGKSATSTATASTAGSATNTAKGDASTNTPTESGNQAIAGKPSMSKVIALMKRDAPNATYSQPKRSQPNFYDCSSFTCRHLKEAGFNVNPLNTTATMKDDLVKAGFTWHPGKFGKDTSKLKYGDILLAPGKHVETYLGNNMIIGARNTKPYPKGVGQVRYFDSGYTGFLRLGDGEDGVAEATSQDPEAATKGDAPTSSPSENTSTGKDSDMANGGTRVTKENLGALLSSPSTNGTASLANNTSSDSSTNVVSQSAAGNSGYNRDSVDTSSNTETTSNGKSPDLAVKEKMLNTQTSILDVIKEIASNMSKDSLKQIADMIVTAIKENGDKEKTEPAGQKDEKENNGNSTGVQKGLTPKSSINLQRKYYT